MQNQRSGKEKQHPSDTQLTPNVIANFKSRKKHSFNIFHQIKNRGVTAKNPLEVCYLLVGFTGIWCKTDKDIKNFISIFFSGDYGLLKKTTSVYFKRSVAESDAMEEANRRWVKGLSLLAEATSQPAVKEPAVKTKKDLSPGTYWILTMQGKAEEIAAILKKINPPPPPTTPEEKLAALLNAIYQIPEKKDEREEELKKELKKRLKERLLAAEDNSGTLHYPPNLSLKKGPLNDAKTSLRI